MRKLALYKEWLIPIEDVRYAEYRRPNENGITDDECEGGTFVKIDVGGLSPTGIRISKKNVLKDFLKWYDEIRAKEINSSWTWTSPIMIGDQPNYCPYRDLPNAQIVPLSKTTDPSCPVSFTSGYVQSTSNNSPTE